MKNKTRLSVLGWLILLFPALLSAQQITETTAYYLMHSSGNHLIKNAEGRAVLQSSGASSPQMLTFIPDGKGYYLIRSADMKGYLSLSGQYDTRFSTSNSSNNARYAIESAGKSFIKLKCKANNKYLGTDGIESGAYVYSDKSGTDSRHYWYLSTDPTLQPPIDTATYIVNPTVERQKFDGWGVSLCWWANMCGKWSDKQIDEIIDWLVSPEGLNFRFFRYNIGGGDDPLNQNCTPHHMGSGKGLRAEMEGFKDSSDGDYIWSRDSAQRKIMLKIKEKRPDAVFEAFSNSCPYYMTYSGCCAGNKDAGKDNLRPEYYEEFAHYLVDVCKHYKEVYGIEFKTLDPFNEPETNYWGANGGQEGCHFDVNSQIAFLKVLHPILKESGLSTVISASDETSVAQSVKDFIAYREAGILDLVGQWNTHTYSADQPSRTQLSALCKEEGMPLWMSEVGDGGSGIGGNLNMAQKLIDDIRYIMPSAWIDWQYIEENNDQWCLVEVFGSFENANYKRVKNYFVRSHFSRFIKEGYTFLTTLNGQTLAARNPEGDSLILVAINPTTASVYHTADLSMYASAGSPIAALRTSFSEDLAPIDDYTFDEQTLTYRLPPLSIVTFIIPVSSRQDADNSIESGETYLICPRISADVALEATAGSVKIKDISMDKPQRWTLETSGKGYTFTNGTGEILTEQLPAYQLTSKTSPQERQSFLITPVDELFYKITTEDGIKAFDLEGVRNTDGTNVGIWEYADYEAPTHRQWIFIRLPKEGITDGIVSPEGPDGHDSAPILISNPMEETLQVEKRTEEEGLLYVYTSSGNCIYSQKLTDTQTFIPLQTGYYLVSYQLSGQSYNQSIIVR